MPPPNITGQLHMGHAIFTTLQDILIRYHRMNGKAALWLPGTDHAGLATQEKLDDLMSSQGLDPKGPDFEWFSEHYKQNLSGEINKQIRRTGASCDWSRYTFTLDEGYSKAVITALEKTHSLGMLYKKDDQWYLDMSNAARMLLNNINSNKLKIIPEHEHKTLRHFLDNIEPWCISRQIRWGHKMPIWTRGDEIHIGDSAPDGFIREEGCLDTWFSSALWPFATLGWPEQTPDLAKFYPASIIETADDILFFWCARMLMMGLILTDQMPFNTIYLHGIMRDKHGLKMSKSLGNGIDPLTIIDQYGCDAMRMALAENTYPGLDMKMWDDKFQSAKSIATKLWNASKYCLNHYRFITIMADSTSNETDLEFLEKLKTFKSRMKLLISNHDFAHAAQENRHFLFNEFCGKYIESTKACLYEHHDSEALYCLMFSLKELLKIGHPFMPFITEHIWQSFNDTMLISEQWG